MKRPCCCNRGACCLPDETCRDNVTQKLCERSIEDGGLGGVYKGEDSICSDPLINCFHARGACCFCENEDDVSCKNTYLQEECFASNGTYQGDDTACETLTGEGFRGLGDPPDTVGCICWGYGACCLPDEVGGGCAILPCGECCGADGGFLGDGTQCVDGICDGPEPPVMGTCCYYPSCCFTLVCRRRAARTLDTTCADLGGEFYPGAWPDDIECETPGPECACDLMINGYYTCWNLNACECDLWGGSWDCSCPCWECCGDCCLHSDCEDDMCCNDGVCEECDDGGGGGDECEGDSECEPLCCIEGQCVNCPWGGDTCCHPMNCNNPEDHEPCPDGQCCVCTNGSFGCSGSGTCCAQCEECPPTGACCFTDGHCAETQFPDICDGEWYGFDSKCEDITCFEETPCNCNIGVCCINEQCYNGYDYYQCLADGGYYGGDDISCVDFECV